VVIWGPTFFLLRDVDTWQLIINTVTTIITFVMVALLQNSQTRSDQAIQHKLNAIADGLADLMAHVYSVAKGATSGRISSSCAPRSGSSRTRARRATGSITATPRASC
jgi:hypothetical protein